MKKIIIATSVKNKSHSIPYAIFIKKKFNDKLYRYHYTTTKKPLQELLQQIRRESLIFFQLPILHELSRRSKRQSGIAIASSSWTRAEHLSLFSDSMLDGITIFQPKGRVIKKYRSIIEEFESKYKMESSFGTIFTFTVMDIINKGIRNTGLVPKKIKTYLEKPRIYDYGDGKVYMNEFGDGVTRHY